MNRRGAVVLVRFPYADGGSKVRPAVVVQGDRYNTLLQKTVIAMVTSNLRRSGEPAHLLIDPANPEGAASGLQCASVVSCNNLYTIEQGNILRTIGQLSTPLLQQLDDCLKASLQLS